MFKNDQNFNFKVCYKPKSKKNQGATNQEQRPLFS